MTPAISHVLPGPFPQIPVQWKGNSMFTIASLVCWKSVKSPTLRSESVTNSGPDKTLLSPALECAAPESKALPLEWILDPDKPRTLLNRILAHLLTAEAKEPNPHYRDDYRIAWLTCKWAFDGIHKPHVAATYRVLGVHPDLVWWHILQDRRARLDKEFSQWFDEAGNLRPDAPKKPATQVPSPMKEAAERSTSERLAALIQFQPKKETA